MHYNKHYIRFDNANRIIAGWSDGPHRDRNTDGAICINEQGGYQFRLCDGGEENPPLYTMDGIPRYKWDGQAVQARSEEEIAADRAELPAPPPSEIERLRQEVARLSKENTWILNSQTDIEMALCETYELLLGGNDNG